MRRSIFSLCVIIASFTIIACANPVSDPAKASNANLASLTPSSGILSPEFSADVTSYSISAPNNVTSITLTGVAADGKATVAGDSGTEKALSVGVNALLVTVTAEDGITKKTYGVSVTRANAAPVAKSSNANLASLTPSSGTLSPEFSADVTSYTISVPNAVTSITLTGVAADANATVAGDSGTEKALTVGANALSVTVTAEDGIKKKTYGVSVTRANAAPVVKSSNANLASLTSSSGTLSPEFSADVTSYSISVPNAVTSITLTGVAADANATVGTGSGVSQTLSTGENTITITVTASDGVSTKTYTVVVSRLFDVVAPKFVDFTVDTQTIDSSNADQTVKGTLTVRDETAMQSTTLYFKDPNDKYQRATLTKLDTSTVTDFVYEWAITIKQGTSGGTWKIDHVEMYDASGNREYTSYFPSMNSFFDTAPEGDTTPPTFVDFTVETQPIDSSNADQTVKGKLTVRDETAMQSTTLYFKDPNDRYQRATLTKLDTSTVTEFVYEWVITIKQGSSGGTWKIDHVEMYDASGNRKYHSYFTSTNSFFDTAPEGDTTPPTFVDFTVDTQTIDSTNADQTVKGTLNVRDETAMQSTTLYFKDPNDKYQRATLTKLDTSTVTDFVYEWEITIIQGSRGGTWKIDYVEMFDASGNREYTSSFTSTNSFIDAAFN